MLSNKMQSGRSMVEIIGVISIVGILSIAGIAGYTASMSKIRKNEIVEQITNLAMSVHNLYESQHNYNDLDNETAISIGLFPPEMVVSSSEIKNSYKGDVHIKQVARGRGFALLYNGLPAEVCTEIAQIDFSPNILYLMISPTGYELPMPRGFPTTLDNGEFAADELPLSVARAAIECRCTNQNCGILMYFK